MQNDKDNHCGSQSQGLSKAHHCNKGLDTNLEMEMNENYHFSVTWLKRIG